uniref:Uncharacterized protein n=1 Tax=Tanacetum cinerariifolium TaxID=118510 RepID=A0A6L2LZU9_TANCI|nr:hypothetical protein [Tanacetum cinerariifolium]
MRTKPRVDTLNFDDLYNNLRVFESDVKGSTGSSSSTHNVAFVSSDNTSSTNEVKTAYGVDEFDLEEMDLKWQVAMISIRLKKFYKKTGRKMHFDAKEPVGFDKSKLSASIMTIHDTLLESADQKGIKIVEGEMQETQNTRQRTMERDLQNRMNIKLWSLLMKKAQTLRSSDVEDGLVIDKFAKVKGIHAVPPHMTGNYMPPKYDFGIDESKFTYGPKQPTTSESDAKTSDLDSCDSSSSEETLETVPKPVKSKPKFINEPKVWSDVPIIEEYESDSDDEYVSKGSVEQEKPSYAFINTIKHVKTPRQTIQEQETSSQNPKVDQQEWIGLTSNRMSFGIWLH